MRLKELRKEKKLLQRQVAEAINCSQAVYSRYESGEREPSKEVLKSLADFHGVSVDYILGRENAPSRPGWVKVTPDMRGEVVLIPEGHTIKVGESSRRFANSEEAGQFKVLPEVVGRKQDGQWNNWGKQSEPLVFDDPVKPLPDDEKDRALLDLFRQLPDNASKQEIIDFVLFKLKAQR